MIKERKRKDIITEEEFDAQVASAASTDPQEDSPGDSETDSGAEFLMGLNFMPGEVPQFEGEGQMTEEGPNPNASAAEVPTGDVIPDEILPKVIKKKTPSSGMGVSSELPSPWADRDENTNIH